MFVVGGAVDDALDDALGAALGEGVDGAALGDTLGAKLMSTPTVLVVALTVGKISTSRSPRAAGDGSAAVTTTVLVALSPVTTTETLAEASELLASE